MNLAERLQLSGFLLGATLFCLPVAAMYAQSNSSESATTSAGVMLIDIRGSGHYWQYEVQPLSGQMRLVKDERLKPGTRGGSAPSSRSHSGLRKRMFCTFAQWPIHSTVHRPFIPR